MKTTIIAITWLGLVAARGQHVLNEYDWQKLGQAGQLGAGAAVVADGKSALRISNSNATALKVCVLKIPEPGAKEMRYAITGDVKYEGVQGDGYLEMLNYFPPVTKGGGEGVYFSRTLGQSGPMGKLTGTSKWRRFILPFDRTGTSNAPVRLELNLFLPAQGTIYISPLKLIESSKDLSSLAGWVEDAWWSDRSGGLIGGIGGATLGCFAGMLAWLAARGRSRFFVLFSLQVLSVLGGVCAIAGIVALTVRQPYGVWFVLLLLGVLLAGICPARLWHYRKRYHDLELRRMASLDVMGG
ncbi:MAG TPA: hypothetical protein VJA21_03885 [Verrucomicrobiae bacterium]